MIFCIEDFTKIALQFGGECEKYRLPTSVLGIYFDTVDMCVLALVLHEFEYN